MADNGQRTRDYVMIGELAAIIGVLAFPIVKEFIVDQEDTENSQKSRGSGSNQNNKSNDNKGSNNKIW